MRKIGVVIAISVLVYPMIVLGYGGYSDIPLPDLIAAPVKKPADAPSKTTYIPSIEKIDVSRFSSTELEIKKSLLHMLFARGWQIVKHERYKITAQYKDTMMEVAINGQVVDFREISPPHKSDYGWISGAASSFASWIEYYYQVRLAEKMITAGSE